MTGWIRTMIGSILLFTIFLQLLPEGKYAKYVRFYAGLFFFLIAAGPVIKLFTEEGKLEHLLNIESLKAEYEDSLSSVAGISELKSETILKSFRSELNRQLEEILRGAGYTPDSLQILYQQEDPYHILEIHVVVCEAAIDQAAVKKEISKVFSLNEDQIQVTGKEMRQHESD